MPLVQLSGFNKDATAVREAVANGSAACEIREAGFLLSKVCHSVAYASGWWNDPKTGYNKDRNVGEMLTLCHSELSEGFEAYRKGNKADDHLPDRPGLEVELADAVIRIFDLGAGLGLDVAGAIAEKLAYNCNRADHKPENRAQPGGKEC